MAENYEAKHALPSRKWPRDPLDWYVEDRPFVHHLFNSIAIEGPIHDPCCGIGTIVDTALSRGIKATGSDIADRANGRFEVCDFRYDRRSRANIVTNPPFDIVGGLSARQTVEIAKTLVEPGGVIAVVAQARFLFSQERFDMYTDPYAAGFDELPVGCERIIIASKRPSMPPGQALIAAGESIRGGGSTDYLWAVWRVGSEPRNTVIDWVL